MHKCILLLMLSVLAIRVQAQEIQWASKVIEVSTYLDYNAKPGQYLPKEVLGPPSMVPGTGSSPVAWASDQPSRMEGEYLVLGYDKPQKVSQIIIHENYNAGAIDRILLGDTEGKTHVVYENPLPEATAEMGKLLKVKIEKTDYLVNAVRIDLQTGRVKGHNQIDAVGISEEVVDYEVKINLAEGVVEDGVKAENLGPAINSTGKELCPVISPDGRTLYFVRQNHPENFGIKTQDIWYAPLNDKMEPETAINIGKPLNNDENSALTAISPDGQRALLLNKYLPNGEMDMGVSIAERGPNGWNMPVALEIDSFYNDSKYGEYFLNGNGRVMIMTIQRKDSEGDKDLYYSQLKEDNNWTEPLSMGSVINTAGAETSPFLAADDRTLYFSTNGRPGYGRNDMYVTRRIGEGWTNWTEPQNLGPVLNTPGWDAYYSIPASGEYVYFVSYVEGGYGEADIYRTKLPRALRPNPVVLVQGKVTDKKTGKPLAATISYSSLSSSENIGTATSDPVTGEYSIVLQAGDLFGFSANREKYLPVSANLDLNELAEFEQVRQDFELSPIEIGARIVLNNLYFDFGQYSLRNESLVELRQIADIMQANPNMKVQIAGHTDDVGSDASNQSLSQNRAQAVVDKLEELGVDRSRLISKGFGESQPAVPNSTDENRQRNRRVEFEIIGL